MDSAPSASSSFCLIAYACSCGKVRKSSLVVSSACLRDLEAIRRKMTAAKERVCKCKSRQYTMRSILMKIGDRIAYCSIVGTLNLFHQAHQEHLRFGGRPIVGKMVFCLSSNIVVGRLQCIQKLRKLGMNLLGQDRHNCTSRRRWQKCWLCSNWQVAKGATYLTRLELLVGKDEL